MRLRTLGLFGLAVFTCLEARATDFSFTGNFGHDDDLQYFTFLLNSPATVTLRTLSYAGGLNISGQAIARGGFDPLVSVFDGTGLLVATQNDGGCPAVAMDSVTNACWDVALEAALTGGSYTVVLTQADNSPFGPFLSDGFLRAGQGDFTGPTYLGSPGAFWDANPNQRTSAWALDILNVQSAANAAVPEPATAALLAAAGFTLCLVRGRRVRGTSASPQA